MSTDPLLPAERAAILARPRPNRALPIFPPEDARRIEPLAEARDKDAAYRPIVAVWEITLRCDLACRHCGSRAGKERPNEMTTAECLDLVRQLAEIGTREVALIGGEAYLRDDWVEIIRAIKAHGMMPTMTTGGRGLTRERAEAAGKAGLYSASVSIDGEEATHDRLRGVQGSWRAALDAMANLRAAGVFIAANTQINRLSMPDLPQVLERIGVAGAKSWQIQLTVAMGRAADEPDVLLQPYDLLELFPMLAALTERAKALRVNIVAGNNIGYFGPYETALRGRTRHGHSTGCGAGKLSIGIEADGAIKGCPSLATKTWTGGNVRETPLRDIWERSNALRYQRDRGTRDLWGYCGTCYYAEQCKAGCTWTTDVLFGRPGNNPFCHHRALEHDKQGLRERIVPVAPAPGEPFDHGLFELVVEPKPAQATQAAEAAEPAQTTRAALLFASATAAVGCSSSSSTGTITDAAVESGPVALYGPAPIYDSGVQDSGGGGLPLYGPAVQDSGSGLPDDGGILAAYGPAPTKDSG